MAGRSLDDLGSESLTWLDLRSIARFSPRSSALFRSMHPTLADWDSSSYLLALIGDLLAAGNWQRGGGKGSRPKPIPRPEQTSTVKNTALSLDDMDRLLGYSPRQ